MNRHIRIVELATKKRLLNPAYQLSTVEIQAAHKVLALMARFVMNKPKAAGVTGALAPVRTGRRAYRLFGDGGCHE